MESAVRNMAFAGRIRKADPADAAGMVEVLTAIVAEGVHSAIERPWPEEEQRRYLESLTAREAVFVAEAEGGGMLGYQSVDRYSAILHSMAHVASLGTFVRAEARGMGVGRALFGASVRFAREQGYAKFVIHVRAQNAGALAFYTGMGFRECGRLERQVRLRGVEEDEVLLDLFL